MIDTRPKAIYIAASVAAALVLLVPSPAVSADYKLHMGATLPRWAKKLEPHRFRSPWGWDATFKWLDRTYPRGEYPRIRIVNMPGVKAVHLANRGRGEWSGINVYELSTGEVRFYVLEREEKGAAKKKTE